MSLSCAIGGDTVKECFRDCQTLVGFEQQVDRVFDFSLIHG